MRSFIRTRLRRALVGIPLVVALLAMTVSISGCKSLFDKQPAMRAAAPAPRVPTGAEKFAAASDTLSTSLETATSAFERGSTDATAIAAVRDFAEQLPKLDKGVAADFAKTRKILSKVDSADKDAIQAKVERTYAERKAALATRLAAVSSAETTAALKSSIAAAADYLDSITPKEPYQPLGTSLPHRIVDAKAGPPVLGARIAPAYAPDTPGAEPSTLPVTPTPEDTTQTVEVVFTPEITSLVASLGADPVRMYEYVRNTIDFEPYYGSRKGATETLLEGSGNDIDTASLLIALYRKANIPARYVSGVVDVPIEKAMNWVGVETPEAAAKLFSAGGTPTKLLISGGRPKALQIEHTWAEVYVDYEDYRGAGAGGGEKVWVPLDGSWKQYTTPDARSLRAAVDSPDMHGLVSALTASATAEGSSAAFANVDAEAFRALSASMVGSLGSVIPTAPGFPRRVGGFGERIEAQVAGLLPSAPGWSAVGISSEWQRCDASVVDSIDIVVGDGLAFTSPLAALAGRTVALTWSPATADDAEIMADRQQADSMAYLVDVRPRLTIDDAIVASGAPLPLGSALQRQVTIGGPGGERRTEGNVLAGQAFSVGVSFGRTSPDIVRRAVGRLHERYAQVGSPEDVLDSDTGEVEHVLRVSDADRQSPFVLGSNLLAPVLTYFMAETPGRDLLAVLAGVAVVPDSSVGFGLEAMSAKRLLGVTTAVQRTGVSLDIQMDSQAVVASTEGGSVQRYGFTSAMLGSATEHVAIGRLFGTPALSAVRALQIANEQRIPIYRIARDNATDLGELNLPAYVRQQLAESVSLGRVVLVPRDQLSLFSWRGVGWIETDPLTGSTGMMIQGQQAQTLAGGDSAEPGVDPSPSQVPFGSAGLGVVAGANAVALGAETAAGSGAAAEAIATLESAIAVAGGSVGGVAVAAVAVVMLAAYAAGTAAGNIAAYGDTVAYPIPGRWGEIPLTEGAAAHILSKHGLTAAALGAIAARAVETREYASGAISNWGGVAIAFRVRPGDEPPFKPYDWSQATNPELGGPFGGWFIVIARRRPAVGTIIVTAFPLEYHVNDPDVYLGREDAVSKWLRVAPLPPVATWTL